MSEVNKDSLNEIIYILKELQEDNSVSKNIKSKVAVMQKDLENSKEEEISLKELIEKQLESYEDFIANKNLKVTTELSDDNITTNTVLADTLISNLLSNAIKYHDKPQGLIKIDCIDDNGYWKFSVSDNGPGIEEKYFEKIFQIFQTLSPRDQLEGTGVGLTLIKKIVTMYGGNIWLESEIGRGSTFFFTLPKD